MLGEYRISDILQTNHGRSKLFFMKKITLILALLFLTFTNIKAQISKGSFSLRTVLHTLIFLTTILIRCSMFEI